MMSSIKQICDIVNQAIDIAFTEQKYNLKFYDYLCDQKYKKIEVTTFINSSLGVAIYHQIEELNIYLEGGEKFSFVKEAYNWMGKSRARKVRDYLNMILEDAKKYEQPKRRGRKPSNKNKQSESTNK